MTPVFRPFQDSDLVRVVGRDGQMAERQTILQQAHAGPSFTFTVDDDPIGCGGLMVQWPGVGCVWMILSDDAAAHGLWLTKTVHAFLDQMVLEHGLHRLEAVALEESTRNQQWLALLGFTREDHGVARALLTDKRSVIRYERIEEHTL